MRLTDISPAAYLSESKARGLEIVRRTLKDALSGVCRPPRAVRSRTESSAKESSGEELAPESLPKISMRGLCKISCMELYERALWGTCGSQLPSVALQQSLSETARSKPNCSAKWPGTNCQWRLHSDRLGAGRRNLVR